MECSQRINPVKLKHMYCITWRDTTQLDPRNAYPELNPTEANESYFEISSMLSDER